MLFSIINTRLPTPIARAPPLPPSPMTVQITGTVSWLISRMLRAMALLAKCKGLRGTIFDVFGYSAERREERQLVRDYEATIAELIQGLNHENHALAIEIASIPEKIRGFGPVKMRSIEAAERERTALQSTLRSPETPASAAE